MKRLSDSKRNVRERELYALNPARQRRKSEEWRRANIEHVRRVARENNWRRLGLDPELCHSVIELQKGLCAICENKPTSTPCIDHDHATLKVRGMLCNNCNVGIGRLKDSIFLLERAISYLKSYQ